MNSQDSSFLPGGTVTFLFTDIEGSTSLLKRLREKYVGLLDTQRRIHRDSFKKWNGHEVGMEGDSFFMTAHSWPEGIDVRVRMGLHTGEPIEIGDEGYIGIDVHRAARIAHAGHGGQVLLSETTTALVRDQLPDSVSLLDLGLHLLKDMDRPEHIHQLVISGLQRAYPPLKSLGRTVEGQKELPTQRSQFQTSSSAEELLEKASIVVLPFVNMSSDQENEYFSDGLTEEVIADLSKVHELRVISRTSAMMLKNSSKDSKTIGRDLKVRYLLEGSVRKAGNSLRITAQLIDTHEDTHLWAEKYTGSLEDVFEIQETLSRKIVDACKVELTSEEMKLVKKKPVSPAAHQVYLRGRYHLNLASPEGFHQAIPYFKEAVKIENNYALAYAGMATAYNYLGWSGAIAKDVYPEAKRAAQKALEIDDRLPEAHLELGYTATFYDWDWEAAERHLKRAIELNPNSSQAYLHYSWYLFSQLQAEDSHAAIQKASELDPLSLVIQMNLPNYYHLIGDYDTMLELSQKTLEMAPFAITAILNAGFAYSEKGLFQEASHQFQRVVELTGLGLKGLLGYSLAMAGDKEKAIQAGCDDYDTKPVDFKRLLEKINKNLGI